MLSNHVNSSPKIPWDSLKDVRSRIEKVFNPLCFSRTQHFIWFQKRMNIVFPCNKGKLLNWMSFFLTNIVNWMFSNTLVRLDLYFSWIIFEIFVHSFTVFFLYWSFYFRNLYTCYWLVPVFHPKLKKESIVVESYFALNFLCGCRMDLYKWWKYYFSLSSQECGPFLVRPVCLSFKSLLFFLNKVCGTSLKDVMRIMEVYPQELQKP